MSARAKLAALRKGAPTNLLDREGLTGAEVKRRAAAGEPVVQKGLRVATPFQDTVAKGAAVVAGAAEGLGGTVGLAADIATAPLRSARAALRVIRSGGSIGEAQRAGASAATQLPATRTATEAATDLEEKIKGAAGIDSGVATAESAPAIRAVVNVAMPGPEAAAVSRGTMKAVKEASTLADDAAEALLRAERIRATNVAYNRHIPFYETLDADEGERYLIDEFFDSTSNEAKLAKGREIYESFEPWRQMWRREHGPTIKLFRYDPPESTHIPNRTVLHWSEATDRDFIAGAHSQSGTRKLIEREVPVEDVVAAPHTGNRQEFIVLNRKSSVTADPVPPKKPKGGGGTGGAAPSGGSAPPSAPDGATGAARSAILPPTADELALLERAGDAQATARTAEPTFAQQAESASRALAKEATSPAPKPPAIDRTAAIVAKPDPVKKVLTALKEAKPLRKQQEAIYSAERKARIESSIKARESTAGEAGFRAELSPLRGEIEKVQFESIRSQIGQEDVDSLFDMVRDAPDLTDWEKIRARVGLSKLFGERGGAVPQQSELSLLKRVFGPEFTDAAASKQGMFEKFKNLGLEIANIPRALRASFDLSAPFRQGIFFIGKPRRFGPAFVEMFRDFGSEKAYQALEESIRKRPSFQLMQESGLAITDLESMATREEQFASNLAEKIPVLGHVVRASGRAYSGFLTQLRADIFDDLVARSRSVGLNPDADDKLARSIAGFVNAGTGRGEMTSAITGRVPSGTTTNAIEQARGLLNALFFSPKLIASRMMLMNPLYYARQPGFVRKEALKSALTFVGAGTTVASLAGLAGAEVGTDARSSDFAKIKFGNTRIDIWGGFQQYARMAAQLYTGKYVSATTGKEFTLGEGFKPMTRYDILRRQIESKEAPIAAFATNVLKQQDFRGQPVSVANEAAELFTPLIISDMYELLQDDPSLVPLGALSLFGFGVQNFEKGRPRKSALIDLANKVTE